MAWSGTPSSTTAKKSGLAPSTVVTTTQPSSPAAPKAASSPRLSDTATASSGVPVALTALPQSGDDPLHVTFTATCPTCIAWVWDFGDNTTFTTHSLTQNHIYTVPGTYYVLFAGTDANGTPLIAQTTIEVATGCKGNNPYATIDGTFYTLPAWFLAKNPPVTWVQPADLLYTSKLNDPGTPDLSDYALTNTRAGDSTLYCQWLFVQGGKPPYTFSVVGAPPGLNVDPVTGLYGGHALVPGKYQVSFCATDSDNIQACTQPREQVICDGGKTMCSL